MKCLEQRVLVLAIVVAVLTGCANTNTVDGFERISSFLGSTLVPVTSSFDKKTKKAAVAVLIMAEENLSGEKFGVTRIERVTDLYEKWFVKRADDSTITYDVHTDGQSIKVAWEVPDHPNFRNQIEFEI